jgi:hypothetical protein
MTQEKFSTLEECCEFATQFCLLTPKKKLEQKDNMVAMHIALARHIDELINRVCTRHDLECQWEWNYGLCWRGSAGRCYSRLCLISLFPNIVFYGANYIREVILHELAHLTNPHHRRRFWKTNIAYLQEEGLLPEGEVTEEEEVVEDRWGRELKYHSLYLNGKLIVYRWEEDSSLVDRITKHNPLLAENCKVSFRSMERGARAMKAIIREARDNKQLNIKFVI